MKHHYNQLLSITTQIEKIGTKSFVIVNEIMDADSETIIARGKSVMVYYDFENKRSVPLPEELQKMLAQYQTEGSGRMNEVRNNI